jgi:phosphatidate cytidylyltransferase
MNAVAKPASRWRDFAPRLASAMVLAPLVLGAIWYGGWVWQGLLTLLATVAVIEWVSLCGLKLDSNLAVCAFAAIPAAQAAYLATAMPAAPIMVVIAAVLYLAWRRRILGAGVLWIGAGYLAMMLLRERPGGHANLLFLLLVVWANDIGAYLAGRLIGGRKMAPRLSPGKTWAGAGGGLVFSIFAGLGVAAWFGATQAGQFRAEALAAGLSILAQAGDLVESAMKRHAGRKDSGQLIPGHGGLLDRVDGLLTAAPAALVWAMIWRGAALWQ